MGDLSKLRYLKKQLESLIRVFLDKIIDHDTFHFHLFFDKDWTVHSDIDSYGHDIEGSWLLFEAAEVLGDETLIKEVEHISIKMADVTEKEGINANGGVYYEKEGEHLKSQFDWWPQAEAVVGFFNAWQISKNDKYLDLSIKSWEFIQKNIIDTKNGEWFWGVDANLKILGTDKVSPWKATYHNSRMCLEMIRRIERSID